MSESPLPEPARAFLDGDVDLLPGALAPAELERLVGLLVERGDAERLARLSEAKDKAAAKAARRGLHLLRTRGQKVPERKREPARVLGPYAPEPPVPSLASLIDGRGERIVWLVKPSADGGGFEVHQAELSETHGLIGYEIGAVARKEWRRHAQQVIRDTRFGVAEVPERHARWLIEQAYQRSVACGRTVPEAFAHARLDLGPAEPETEPPALALAPPYPVDEVRGRLGSLAALPEVRTWAPPEAALEALDLELGQIATSQLLVDEAQRLSAVRGAVARVAGKALTPEWRRTLAGRLHETAYLFALRGQLDEARLCTTAAALTLDEAVPAEENPLVMTLFDRLVDAARLAPGGAP